ncbi:MAG: iron complex outermembrane receptor protein [Arenicella sp.]|jgi:iron complex outermembrane receptor protein
MKYPHFYIGAFALASLSASIAIGAPLDEITVTAELLENNVLELPNSVTIIDQATIEQRSAQHLEDLLNLAPNVNFASGASRGRFIQIRGIGERSEFQEPINNSVGVVVDGIDLTGIATAASTLDVQQVEVLRGPQGTLFGANALAGLINVVSNKPSDSLFTKLTAAVEDFGGLELSGLVSGPTSDNAGYRLAVKHYASDGFSDNVFLNRQDTNNIDETTARARYLTQINDRLNVDLTVFVADIRNGYDAFSLDNTRQTYSDQPGVDIQKTRAVSASADYKMTDSLSFQGLISLAHSDLEYSFDEDWGHDGICQKTACDSGLFGFDWFYSSIDNYQRQNDNTSIDLRLVSNAAETHNWVFGLYQRDQKLDLARVYTFAETDFSSQLSTSNTAIYGQYDLSLASQWSLSTGLRFEQRDLDYDDNSGATANPEENLWGGRIAIEYLSDSGAFYYGLISRGYKPGGFNLEASIAEAQREYETETMINYELGVKHLLLDGKLQLQSSVFYQDRDAIQTKQSIVASIASGELGGLCPCSFTDFTDNATSGSNKGLELEFNWSATDQIQVYGSLGVLDTKFDTFLTFEHINADRDNGQPFDLAGREQAHAPGYQWVLGGSYSLAENWQISGSIEAKDAFFFSNRHEAQSDQYELLNLELSYHADRWRLALYAKNLADELVKTRGFGSFGNDPRKFYETEPYNQFAAPRLIGMKASFEF